jgi:hypothetical protein
MRAALAFSLLWLSHGMICAQVVPPVLLQKVEPEDSVNLKSWLSDPARIQMIVAPDGLPYSLTSTTSLPDNVVQALAKWKFKPGTRDGARSAFTVILEVPIRRPVDQYLTRAHRPWLLDHTHPRTPIPAKKLTPESALKVEEKLANTPAGIDQRIELLTYSSSQ